MRKVSPLRFKKRLCLVFILYNTPCFGTKKSVLSVFNPLMLTNYKYQPTLWRIERLVCTRFLKVSGYICFRMHYLGHIQFWFNAIYVRVSHWNISYYKLCSISIKLKILAAVKKIKSRKSKTLGKTEFRLHIFQSPNIYGVLCDHKTTSIVSSFSSLT